MPPHVGAAAALVAGCILLASCATVPPGQRTPESKLKAVAAQAQAAEEQGDLDTAEELQMKLANLSTGSDKAAHLTRAAHLDIRLDRLGKAKKRLDAAAADANPQQQLLISILRADISVHSDNPRAALTQLEQLPKKMPTGLMLEAARVRADAYFASGQLSKAVQTLVERGTWLNTSAEVLANQKMIWAGLAASITAPPTAPKGNTVIDGWLALTPIAQAHLQGTKLRQALMEWRRRYPKHPAARGLLGQLLHKQRNSRTAPARIALLLPLSSAQREAAVALRNGFLAESLASGNADRTAVRIYDTTKLGPRAAYKRAQLEGADFIVGPLLRPAVKKILPVAGLIPTLALNFVKQDADPAAEFYQFALAPEDEVREIARQAVAAGRKRAIVLYPSTDWGYRVFNSFRIQLEALGGTVLGYAGYRPGTSKFTSRIESLLNLDQSKARRRKLAGTLGRSLQFQPRRRQDVQMLLIATNRTTGLLLVPALEFHFARDIPTYATSEIFEAAATTSDHDLDSVYFPGSTWLLTPTRQSTRLLHAVKRYWPRTGLRNIRLYGMGVDAYRLAVALYSGDAAWPLSGVSGELVLRSNGQIHRRMPLAQFQNGKPVAVHSPLPMPQTSAVPAISLNRSTDRRLQ